MFQSRIAVSLDAKGRFLVPARFRDDLITSCQGQLTLSLHKHGSVMVYPRSAWEHFRDTRLLVEGTSSDTKRFYLGNAIDIDVDGAGRVNVPSELREWAGLVKDAYLTGVGERYELWDKARWHERTERTVGEVADV